MKAQGTVKKKLAATEWFAWALLVLSLLIGLGMTAFAPN
jgi:hypothetical protein